MRNGVDHGDTKRAPPPDPWRRCALSEAAAGLPTRPRVLAALATRIAANALMHLMTNRRAQSGPRHTRKCRLVSASAVPSHPCTTAALPPSEVALQRYTDDPETCRQPRLHRRPASDAFHHTVSRANRAPDRCSYWPSAPVITLHSLLRFRRAQPKRSTNRNVVAEPEPEPCVTCRQSASPVQRPSRPAAAYHITPRHP